MYKKFTAIYCGKTLFNLINTSIVMKLFSTLLIISIHISVFAFGQSITLHKKNASLISVMKEIKEQSGYHILYDADALLRAPRIEIGVNAISVSEALDKCLAGLPLKYVIKDNSIIISKIEGKVVTSRPQKEIAGKVTTEQGEPLEGVTVQVKNTQSASITNSEGYYKINIPEGGTILAFSTIGYMPQEIIISSSLTVNATLKESISDLDEVVIVGYGTQKKTSLTAAVSSIKGEEVASIPVTSLGNVFGGRVPGVIVRQSSGEPGRDGSNIYIRGISSTGGNQPLLVVDGIPRDFNKLAPNTIESFTVLKDAAAVAPYGVAGANGVILVTTKRGKTGLPSLTYNGYVGFQNPTARQKSVSPYQFALLKNEVAINSGLPVPYDDYALQKFQDGTEPDVFPVDDVWGALAKKNSILTSHNIEVVGGSDRIKYYSSLGYQYQEGLWPTTHEKKYNLTLNLDADVSKSTKLSFNVNGRVQKDTYPPIGTQRIFELIGYSHPARGGPLVFSNGMYGKFIMGSIYNTGYAYNNGTGINTQFSVEQKLPFIPGLTLKGTVAYDPTFTLNKTWLNPVQLATIDTTQQPYVINDGVFGDRKSSLTENYNQSYQLTYQASLNYSRTFGKNGISALAVFEAKDNNALSLGAARRNYNLAIDELNMGSSSQADLSNNGSSSVARQMGIVYRLTYDYNAKYLFEASGRYDGSYYFAPAQRFGFFPAFSVGWRLSEERFMEHVNWVDNLKIRGSYGEVGALAGSAFQYLSSYAVSGPAYVIGGNAVQAVSERSEPNRNITWERARKKNVGLEATLWKGLLNIEADYFFEKRSNMLVTPSVIVPSEYGIGLSQVNAGVMKNEGFEFSIGTKYNFTSDLQASLGGNFTFAKNTLLQVFETAATYDNPNRRVTGKPLGTQFGYHALGLFQVDDFDESGNLKPGISIQPWGDVQPGDIRYEDINNDGQINNDDLTKIGDAQVPQIIYGIVSGVQYKNFNLDLLFQGTGKRDFYLSGNGAWIFHNGMGAFTDNLDYWTPENTNASNPRLTGAPTSNNTQVSSFWMKNAAYLRLKNVTLGYRLPEKIIQKLKVQNVRVYGAAQNLLTWSNFESFDPEISDGLGLNYPQQKVVSFGLDITF